MTPRRLASLIAALGLGALVGAGSQPQADADPTPGPVVQWAGPHSAIERREFHLVTDRKAFAELWARHRGDRLETNLRDWPVVPSVDFDHAMVVAFFRGPSRVDDGEYVREVIRRGDELVIRFDALTFQTDIGLGGKAPDYACAPYGIWVVDRHHGAVVIQEDQRHLIQAPPEWVEVHRFDRR